MAALDPYGSFDSGVDGPIRNSATVVPNDGADLAYVTRGLWVGTAGDLNVVMKGGMTQTWPSASGWMPMQVTRVLATGTTATGIVAGW